MKTLLCSSLPWYLLALLHLQQSPLGQEVFGHTDAIMAG